MKILNKILFSIIILATLSLKADNYQILHNTDKNGYSYEEVTNDPLKARIYTLKNGLKVYMSRNPGEPRVAALIGVRAGSADEPLDSTGLAHYFEHMMFKGTDKIGALDWQKEKLLLQQISDLYEKHRTTDDPAKKKEIYKEIDKLSHDAAKYANSKEFDNLSTAIGSQSLNAHTSFEATVYRSVIPANELKRWAQLESERFANPKLRLFHTELETVYEEYNMSQDRDTTRAYYALLDNIFPNHPYGRMVIGLPEHLKSPSMKNIYQFFDDYYVPNNMAIALAGDLDFESAIKTIDTYFGKMKSKKLTKHQSIPLKPIEKIVEKDIYGPSTERLYMAYRFGGCNSEDAKYLMLISRILSNGRAGLIDLDLIQKQKVLGCYSSAWIMPEYSLHMFTGTPREGQSLGELKKLILAEIDKVKKGQFDDWLLKAIINDMKLSQIRSHEHNLWRGYALLDDFVDGKKYVDTVKLFDDLSKITKADIVRFANKHYRDNYVVINKRTGKNDSLVKVDKPKITPIKINSEKQSAYAQKFLSQAPKQLKPEFVDFDKAIVTETIIPGVDFKYVKNKTNDLFTLSYIIDKGSFHDKKFELAVSYLPYLGTSKYSPEELKKELFKHGLTFSVSTGRERSHVVISGLSDSLPKGIELLEHILANLKVDQDAYNKMVEGILKKRTDQKLNYGTILYGGMINYGLYGNDSPFKYILSEKELKSIDPKELIPLIKDISNNKHIVYYYGPENKDKVGQLIKQQHNLPAHVKDIPAPRKFIQIQPEKSPVYVVDYDISQVHILMVANAEPFDKKDIPFSNIFNNYFGAGMSSIVFQEIRDSKGLAYSAYCVYQQPSKADRRNVLYASMSTQADKLPEAIDTMRGLFKSMPKAERSFKTAKKSITSEIDSQRIKPQNLVFRELSNKDLGIDYDIRKDVYDAAQTLTMEEFEKQFDKHIKGRTYTYLILGKLKNLDMNALKKLGDVKQLSLEEIFGY